MFHNKIIAKQTYIEINNYFIGDCPALENAFSVYDRLYHRKFFKGIIYDDIKCKLLIPRSVNLNWLKNLFGEDPYIDYKYNSYDELNTNILLNPNYKPREVQKQAIRFMLGEQEYYDNKGQSRISVNLNTGKGKTYCTIFSLAVLKMKTIIITSSIDWLNQWKKFILEYTNINIGNIYLIDGSPSVNRLFKNDKLVNDTDIFLVSHATLKSYGDKNGWDKITQLFERLKVGIKVYDEAHLNFDNIYNIDYYTNVYKTFYVTATPMRSDQDEDKIYQKFMKGVPSIDLFDRENDPHTKYIAMLYNSQPTPMEASKCKNQYGLDRNRYTNYLPNKDNFYHLLHILMHKILYTNGKTLIYIGTNSTIEIIYNWIISNYPVFIGNIGIYTSLTTTNKEAELSKKVILTTTKSCGAAVDIKGLKTTIILAEPFKSGVLARQTLGRTRDNDTEYIDVVDTGFYYTKGYYKAKIDIFNKYATSCTEVRINNMELQDKSYDLYEYYKGLTPCITHIPDGMINPITIHY